MFQSILRNLAVTALIRNRVQNKTLLSSKTRKKNAELDKHLYSERKIATWKLKYYKYVLFNEMCFIIFLDACLDKIPVFFDTLRRIQQTMLIGFTTDPPKRTAIPTSEDPLRERRGRTSRLPE